jgi:hypothetical protein
MMSGVEHTCTPVERLLPDYREQVNQDSIIDLCLKTLTADLRCPRCLFAFNATGLTDVQACNAVVKRHDLEALVQRIVDARSIEHADAVYERLGIGRDDIPF